MWKQAADQHGGWEDAVAASEAIRPQQLDIHQVAFGGQLTGLRAWRASSLNVSVHISQSNANQHWHSLSSHQNKATNRNLRRISQV
jgi:hypothetical protein